MGALCALCVHLFACPPRAAACQIGRGPATGILLALRPSLVLPRSNYLLYSSNMKMRLYL